MHVLFSLLHFIFFVILSSFYHFLSLSIFRVELIFAGVFFFLPNILFKICGIFSRITRIFSRSCVMLIWVRYYNLHESRIILIHVYFVNAVLEALSSMNTEQWALNIKHVHFAFIIKSNIERVHVICAYSHPYTCQGFKFSIASRMTPLSFTRYSWKKKNTRKTDLLS